MLERVVWELIDRSTGLRCLANDVSQLKSGYGIGIYGLWSFVGLSLARARDTLGNIARNEWHLSVLYGSYRADVA